jgi:ATP-dependent Zn protease
MPVTDPMTTVAAAPPRPTRKPLALWDRVKFLLLAAVLFGLFVWNDVASFPTGFLPVDEALSRQLDAKWWIVALAGVEVVRQLHYLVSERSARWHRFWTDRVFGGFNRRAGRLSDWNRYRIGRVLRWGFVLVVADLIVSAILDISPARTLVEAPARAWDLLPFVLQLMFGFLFVAVQFLGIFWLLSRGGTDVYFPEDIDTRFTDVWGQDHVVDRIKENIVFLEHPEAIEEKGGFIPGGVLLWGPPGTGKTLIAEAVAGETGKPFVFVDPGAFINMFFGIGILKVKSLFRKLRKLAVRYGGVIVFFDEADSLGNRGAVAQGGWNQGMAPLAGATSCHGPAYLSPLAASQLAFGQREDFVMGAGMGGGGGMGTLQALLTEISGLKKPRGFFNRYVRRLLGMRPKPPPRYRILIMMATNMPQALDDALLRPGRIDRIYRVGYPSKAGRIRTYEGYLAKVHHELTPEQVDRLATITPYATGATIKDLLNEALITAIRDGRDTIIWADVVRAKALKSLGPGEDVEYIERERHAVAVHEACHAVAAWRVRRHLTIDMATIEKGSDYLGMVASIPMEEQFTGWQSEYESDVIVSLASLAGERMFFEGDSSSGVSGDLRSATTIAMMMEGYWGMGSSVGSRMVSGAGVGKPLSGIVETGEDRQLLESALGERIEARLVELYERTEALLVEHRGAVLAVAHALETHKTLTGEDVVAVIEGRPGPLVDGTGYRDPAFLAEAERYHRSVVEAHKRHASVELTLPLLGGRPPQQVEAVATSLDQPPS